MRRGFTLEPVLRHREQLVLETQREITLLEAQLAEVERRRARCEELSRHWRTALGAGQQAAEPDLDAMRRHLAEIDRLRLHAEREQTKVWELTGAIAAKREELLSRTQDHKALVRLKERRRSEAERQMDQAEIKHNDEMATQRHAARRAG